MTSPILLHPNNSKVIRPKRCETCAHSETIPPPGPNLTPVMICRRSLQVAMVPIQSGGGLVFQPQGGFPPTTADNYCTEGWRQKVEIAA